jgi:hypothetical protein
MAQRLSGAARLWKILTQALEKPMPSRALATDVLPGIPGTSIQIPEEGAIDAYELFCRIGLGDRFNDERYTALRKLGYGQYSTVWLARDSRQDSIKNAS